MCLYIYIYIHNNRCVCIYIYYSQENFALLVDISNNYITIHNYIYTDIYIEENLRFILPTTLINKCH